MDKDILYGIKTVGHRFYIAVDEAIEHYTLVTEFKDALLFKEEKYAKQICKSLNKNTSMSYETFKVSSTIFK